MGAGGQMSVPPVSKNSDVFRRSPHSKPPYNLGEIKKAIPPHCFRRSILRSFSYVVYDLTAIYVLYYIATNYFHLLPHPLPYLAWPLYWLLVGCIIAGIWVIAHECGHHAFSDYQWLDNTVGFMLHSALLIPYFSWKYSHRSHHSNIASLERDEVFIPKTKSKINPLFKYFNNPLGRVLLLTIQFTLGMPLYLAFNATGRHYDGFANHFYPYSPIYTDRERIQIYLSDAGVLAVGYGLYRLVAAKGLAWFLCAYAGPWIFGHGIVVTITYLQHTHPSLPRYDSSEWDWLRGSLSTVDRDYGILNHVFHHINDTHVVHHLFSTMPHYHATEATKVIKPLLGDYYQADATPIIMAMWREAKECIYVEKDEGDPSKGVFWFKKKL